MNVIAHLADGSVIEGRLDWWGEGWIMVDGRVWDGVVFWRSTR